MTKHKRYVCITALVHLSTNKLFEITSNISHLSTITSQVSCLLLLLLLLYGVKTRFQRRCHN